MKKIQFLLSLITIFVSSAIMAQSEVERSLGDFSGVVFSLGIEGELIKGSSNKVVLTFTGVKEKLVTSEIVDGKLVVGYKGDKKPDGATLKAKVYTSSSVASVELSGGSSIKASGISWTKDVLIKVSSSSKAELNPTTSNLDVRVNGKSTLKMNAKATDAFLSLSSSGKAEVQIEAKSLEAKVAARGRLDISGTSDDLTVVSNNSAKYMGYEMKCKNLTAQAHSSGYAEVYASESIIVNVVSEGKVFYKGNPADTKFNGTSSGKIEKAD